MPEASTEERPKGAPHPASDAAEAERLRLLEEHRQREAQREGDGERSGRDLINAAADDAVRGGKQSSLSNEEQVDALEWFLADSDEEQTYTFDINVGTPTHKKWASWTITSVDMDELKRIRKQSVSGNRRERRQGQSDFDEVAANVQIVLRGTVAPDLRAAAKRRGLVDPADLVRMRFKHKPGLIAQIAGEVMSLSGYDDEDVREVDAARG